MISLPKLPKPPTDGGPKWFQIAIAASMVISTLSAVYGSIKTSLTMEALVKENTRLVMANSTPLLELSSGNLNSNENELYFSVANVGNGPARIAWFKIKGGDRTYDNIPELLSRQSGLVDLSTLFLQTDEVAPRLISAGKEIAFFRWPQPGAEKKLDLAAWKSFDQFRQRGNLTVKACFCSVLDACWTSNLQGDIPKPVVSCDALIS